MNSLPKISVVTITYGHQDYITETLDGVFMQQYDGPIEFIIANDNSPDNTDEVVKEYLTKHTIPDNFEVKYTKHPQNIGMMPNFIWALNQATGKYIALCEGDDYWTDVKKLEKQVAFLEEDEEFVLIHTNYDELVERGGVRRSRNINTIEDRGDEFEFYLKTGDIRTCTTLFRANYMMNINDLFSMSFMIDAVVGDRPLFLLLSKYGKIYYLPDSTSVYNISETNSASHFKDIYKYYNYLSRVSTLNEKLYSFLEIEGPNKNEDRLKFLKIVELSQSSIYVAIFKMFITGLIFKYYTEFKSVLYYRFKKNKKVYV